MTHPPLPRCQPWPKGEAAAAAATLLLLLLLPPPPQRRRMPLLVLGKQLQLRLPRF